MNKQREKVFVIVDDKEYLSLEIKKFLIEEVGFNAVEIITVFKSTTQEEVLDKIERINPDIVLLDHDLQNDFDGRDIADKLKISEEKYFILGTSAEPQNYCKYHWDRKCLLDREHLKDYSLEKLVCELEKVFEQELN